MADIAEHFDTHAFARFLKTAHHFMPIGIIGGQESNLFTEFGKGIAAHRACGHMRGQGLVEGVFRKIRHFVDGVGLADRIEDHAALFGDIVDGQLHGCRQTADDEIGLVVFDQFERAGGRFARIELVVAHQQFGLASAQAATGVEFGNRHFGGADLILCLGPIGTGQRNGKADLDGGFLRPRRMEREGSCSECRTTGDQAATIERGGL